MIDNPTGMPPIVVWAHYILGLNVLITNSPDGDVGFGSIESPQVRIKWDSEWSLNSSHSDEQGSTSSNLSNTRASPDIYLLDADMHVLLETEPSENTATEIVGQESHRLRGYGTTFLRRLFNTDSLITDDDPIFADTANFAVTVAILFSRKMRRSSPSFGVAHQQENPKQCYFNTPQWPLFNASHVLFWGIELDKRKIVGQLGKLVGTRVIDMALPTNLRNYISRIGQPNHDGESPVFENYPQDEFLAENMHKLVSWILSFAQVIGVESCHDLPLRILPNWVTDSSILSWDIGSSIDIQSHFCFDLIRRLMRNDSFTKSSGVTSSKKPPNATSENLFLTCHQGWSLFYSSVGDYDPEEISCELVYIRQGVPTNTRTGERKNRIADALMILQTPQWSDLLISEDSYIPRCAKKVYKRTEHYSTKSSEFWLSIRYNIEDSEFHGRTPSQKRGRPQKYSIHASHA